MHVNVMNELATFTASYNLEGERGAGGRVRTTGDPTEC